MEGEGGKEGRREGEGGRERRWERERDRERGERERDHYTKATRGCPCIPSTYFCCRV